jgi:carbamate kinase
MVIHDIKNPPRMVIALGGNALQSKGSSGTAEEQLHVVEKTSKCIADISMSGYEIVVVHGNGPQVGQILLAFETAADVTPVMPFDVCGAMSQGYIGYHLQKSLRHEFNLRNKNVPVVCLLTQTVVEKTDSAFLNPTKPVGLYYTEEEAKELEVGKGYHMIEDSGRGWRRVVPSPEPKRIVELESIKNLWKSTIVIAVGGGGIPVVERPDGVLEGIDAVIDKDLASERLAEDIGADVLLILTEVDKVAINFGKPDQQDLDHLTVAQAAQYIEEEQFAPGSMLPKVLAATRFVRANPDKKAIITSLGGAMEALEGNTGTTFTFA